MKTVYFTTKDLFETPMYEKILWNGGRVLHEITLEGDVEIYFCAPNITKAEMEEFNNGSPRIYHYERYGMSSLLFADIFDVECCINPSYYTDNRYELFKQKEEVEIFCFLCDIERNEIVGAKILTLSGEKLERVKKGFELNSKHTRSEYEDWIENVLYANDYKTNKKMSTYIGFCDVPSDREFLLI